MEDLHIQNEYTTKLKHYTTHKNDLKNTTNHLKGIAIKNVSFRFGGFQSSSVLNDISFFIPEGKTTAIVGESGSGKTTLMKILLMHYTPTNGMIEYNNPEIKNVSHLNLMDHCGAVMQNGTIFSDTIEKNITVGAKNIDYQMLDKSIYISNIGPFIANLPLSLTTKIGIEHPISGGEKQKILIARAIYKNPKYLFFDEATSALDSNNERIIYDNLQECFKNKTVVVIANRLSTIKSADQIVVLKDGTIAEIGNHQSLLKNKSTYYNLVKHQLDVCN
ncbi:ATP-binding cassette domain-containing protein [Chryseobacterium taiwanense]|uniref:ATP-binding cassette domain-containing protein n=1 Tax=Chryseobacterium taiwanense TaxID=363331 RepID=UPI00068D8484|nr:ATP-binding cassette domain-containing protein [Chryseobacterium taiwanense]